MLIDDSSRDAQAREIELELIRVRSAAEAARLEARAAELELMLRRMVRGADTSRENGNSFDPGIAIAEVSSKPWHESRQGGTIHDNWSTRLERLHERHAAQPAESQYASSPSIDDGLGPNVPTSLNALPPLALHQAPLWHPKLPADGLNIADHSTAKIRSELPPTQDIKPSLPNIAESGSWTRTDAGTDVPSAHHLRKLQTDAPDISPGRDNHLKPQPDKRPSIPSLAMPRVIDEQQVIDEPEVLREQTAAERMPTSSENAVTSLDITNGRGSSLTPSAINPIETPKPRPSLPIPDLSLTSDHEEEQAKRKFRPASFLVSTLAHVAVLVLLGLMTLASTPPKDQLAFTASASESSEETMETFSIESSEPTEPTEPVSETAYEVSDVGTMAITEVSLDAPPAMAAPSTAEMFSSSSSSLSSASMKALKETDGAKMQFCGVDGGGSHFVYLVDSSGSMREGFQSARDELLASIDQLKPDQRFYVVFFDKNPDYMRISNPSVDEPSSVMATPENKKKLRGWAMTVQMDEGKAPYEVLPFALTLRPDVIFLLSDGEFPSKIEEILREQNHEENLFGESGPISIVHTIRYHGIEGQVGRDAEATMMKIAKENGGQYRHVPKPKR